MNPFEYFKTRKANKLSEDIAVLEAKLRILEQLNMGESNSYYLDREIDVVEEITRKQHRLNILTEKSS